MKRARIAYVGLALLVCAGLAWAANQPRPKPGTIHAGAGPVGPGMTWTSTARDTTVLVTWGRVENDPITQPTTADTLRLYSTNTADSTWVRLVGINSADSNRVEILVRVSGTDTTFVGRYKFTYLEGVFCDSASAGQIRIKAKTGTGTVFALPVGALQLYSAHHFYGQREGGVIDAVVQGHPAPIDSTVYFQLRQYRLHRTALASPEQGYSLLWEGESRGGTLVHVPLDIDCPRESYLIMFARTTGTSARAFVKIRGYDR